jgi:hypothetical protein
LAKKSSTKKTASKTSPASISVAAGITGIVLAAWLIYGTVTIDPFRWGRFVEELIVAVCALSALRLLCILRLPSWVSLACVAILPAGIAAFAFFSASGNPLALGRLISLAAACAFALLTARELDAKPDGTLLATLLIAVCLPSLIGSGTSFLVELLRALTMAGIYLAVLAVRQKSTEFLYLAAVGFGLGGVASLFSAFAGAGAALGAALLAPKRKQSAWVFPAVLCAALPVAAWLLVRFLLPLPEWFSVSGAPAAFEFAAVVQPHLMRALDLGLLLLAIHLLAHREDGAIPALFAVAASMLTGFVPSLSAPDVWMQALPLAVLAGVGTAKTGRS